MWFVTKFGDHLVLWHIKSIENCERKIRHLRWEEICPNFKDVALSKVMKHTWKCLWTSIHSDYEACNTSFSLLFNILKCLLYLALNVSQVFQLIQFQNLVTIGSMKIVFQVYDFRTNYTFYERVDAIKHMLLLIPLTSTFRPTCTVVFTKELSSIDAVKSNRAYTPSWLFGTVYWKRQTGGQFRLITALMHTFCHAKPF